MSAGHYSSYREPSPGGAESNGIRESGGPVGATNQLVDPETLYTKQNAIGVLHCCGKAEPWRVSVMEAHANLF